MEVSVHDVCVDVGMDTGNINPSSGTTVPVEDSNVVGPLGPKKELPVGWMNLQVSERLASIPGVWLPKVAQEVTKMSWFVYVIRMAVDEPNHRGRVEIRDYVMKVPAESEVG